MRIVAGRYRGTPLAAPRGTGTRPTGDRLRESVFNVLTHRLPDLIPGARVLDLFAGSGAMGVEALSRGAAFVLFVETAVDARAAIRRNLDAVGAAGEARIFRRDATRLGAPPAGAFTVAFADPPYGRELGTAALEAAAAAGWLAAGAVAVLEERADALPATLAGFETLDRRTSGDSAVGLYRRVE
ncbi:16S rRNA (guanine(966)-N(2))-methyltransferase RsmD [Acuticoccus sp.]|uniref:16S rRNA (guanine(966)-N(2))-methyltransferase RsmD n=1 Tax=Acuticoccus sp. TaxID=1904378 RepID=UPI003B529ED1